MAYANGDDDSNLISVIEDFVSINISKSVPEHLFRDAEAKKKVEKIMIKKFYTLIFQNRKDIIPPGVVFKPSDAMLIDILSLKNRSRSMPRVIIPEIEVFVNDPWHMSVPDSLQPLGLHELFVFNRLDNEALISKFAKRRTPFGYWKVNFFGVQIVGDSGVAGEKSCLTFYQGRNGPGDKTDWKMHEYRLSEHSDDKWTLCKIYNRLRTEPWM